VQKLQNSQASVLSRRQMRKKGIDEHGWKSMVLFSVSGVACYMRSGSRNADGKNVWIGA
jgi:hypothetical protein